MSSSSNITNGNVVSYDWFIHHFSSYAQSSTYFSPSNFSLSSDSGIKFKFYMNPGLTIPGVDGTYTTVSVNLTSCNRDKVKLRHRMSFMNAKGQKCHTQETLAICKSGTYGPCSILREHLIDPANGLLVELLEDESSESALHAKQENFSSISQHFESLLESGKHSDVVLAIGEKEFRSHKVILSTRSPVFAAMFDHSDTKEAQQGRVEIVDVAVEVFELFLRYLYTDKIDQLDRFAPELLAVADMVTCLILILRFIDSNSSSTKWIVQKSLCEHFLCSTLTIENVSQLLIHADLYRAEVLKSKCADYITDNSKKVKATEGWKTVTANNDLLVLLFDKLSIKFDSK